MYNSQKILISGAGIAGPALAYWLSRYGFDPTVIETASAVCGGGYSVDFRGASLGVLEQMGILTAIEEQQTRMGTVSIVDRANKKLASLPDGFTTGQVEIMRGDLNRILYEATRHDRGVHLRRLHFLALADRRDRERHLQTRQAAYI